MHNVLNKLLKLNNSASSLKDAETVETAIELLKEIKKASKITTKDNKKTNKKDDVKKSLTLDEIIALNTCKEEKYPNMYGQKVHSRLLKHFINNDNFYLIDLNKYNDVRFTGMYSADVVGTNYNCFKDIKETNNNDKITKKIEKIKNDIEKECAKYNTTRDNKTAIKYYPNARQIHITQGGRTVYLLTDKERTDNVNTNYSPYIRIECLDVEEIPTWGGNSEDNVRHLKNLYNDYESYTRKINEVNKDSNTFIFRKINEGYINNILIQAKYYPALSKKIGLDMTDFNEDAKFLEDAPVCGMLRRIILNNMNYYPLKVKTVLEALNELDDVKEAILGKDVKNVNTKIIEKLNLNLKTEWAKTKLICDFIDRIKEQRADDIKKATEIKIAEMEKRRAKKRK